MLCMSEMSALNLSTATQGRQGAAVSEAGKNQISQVRHKRGYRATTMRNMFMLLLGSFEGSYKDSFEASSMGSINAPLRALEPCPFIQRLQSPITESCVEG